MSWTKRLSSIPVFSHSKTGIYHLNSIHLADVDIINNIKSKVMPTTKHTHHESAAKHHESAAKHHRSAHEAHQSGNREKAASHAQSAHGHATRASEHASEASKSHAEDDNE